MNTKSENPRLYSGDIYFVESLSDSENINCKSDLRNIDEYIAHWKVDRGSIKDNPDNKQLKFDIVPIPATDYYASFFIGFLYPDGKVLGKVKYVIEANIPDVRIEGYYNHVSDSRLLLSCKWENSDLTKEYFMAELIKQ